MHTNDGMWNYVGSAWLALPVDALARQALHSCITFNHTRHPNRCLTLRLNKRIIKYLHLKTDSCQCPFFEKSTPMENTNYTFVRKAKIVGSDARKASPIWFQYPHGTSRIWVRLKMMLECKVCLTLGVWVRQALHSRRNFKHCRVLCITFRLWPKTG